MSKIYTGIGSRETPPDILELMTKIARFMFKQGFTLRSGGADGADSAFEAGAENDKESISHGLASMAHNLRCCLVRQHLRWLPSIIHLGID